MTSFIGRIGKWWDAQPCGVRLSSWPAGSANWSHEVSVKRYYVQHHIRPFAEFSKWKGKRVLEIGCGIGTDTLEFVRAGASVDGVDLSSESLRLAERRVSMENIDPWRWPHFYCLNAESWLPQGPYDLVYSFGVLHHTPHPDEVLKRAWERMAPGSELRLMLYAKWSLKRMLREQPEAQAGCPLVKWYTKRDARRLAEDTGFVVESVEKTHIFPWRVADYVEGRYVKRLAYRFIPRSLFEWLERRLGHHLLIKARKP